MADTLRWRYGETNPIVLPVDSATVIEIGDLVYLEIDDVRPASSLADQGTEAQNQEAFHDQFAAARVPLRGRHVDVDGDHGGRDGTERAVREVTRRVRRDDRRVRVCVPVGDV